MLHQPPPLAAPGQPQAARRSAARPGDGIVRHASLQDDSLALWDRTPASFPRLGARVGPLRRWRNTRAVVALIDHVADRIRACPADDAARAAWRDGVRERVLQVGREQLGWSPAYGHALASDAFYTAAESFARDARRFAPGLALDDLGQALRNVWVGNSLQMLAGAPVQLTPGLFAYSMLYPTTDNVLDNPERSDAAKALFNRRLASRLAGDALAPQDAAGETPWQLVAILEREYPRRDHPAVWAAVLGIHQAQVASLRQQQDRHLSDRDLFALTIAKGGASVLADLYLVTPHVDPPMDAFAFRYGVFLQMLDDLQDVGSDTAAGHQTLFVRAAQRGPLDALTARLAAFIDAVLDAYARDTGQPGTEVVELIRQNCRALIVGVIAREPERFSPGLRQCLAAHWPVGLRGMRRIVCHGQRRFAAVRAELQRAHGIDSPLQWILAEPQQSPW